MKQKKQVKEEGEHEVNITVTIAKCSPTAERDTTDPKKTDSIQVQNYFHCQYKLLPDDKGFVNTDVVTFGDAAKLYADNDSKVLRVWLEGRNTWVAWASSRRIRVTRDTLLKMFKHKCELKFWDTKDKVSAKARFDRPKAFRLPATKNPDEIDLDSVRSLLSLEGKINRNLGPGNLQHFIGKGKRLHGASIISQSTIEEEHSIDSTGKNVSFNQRQGVDSSVSKQYISTTDSKLEVKVRLDGNKQPEFKNLMALASKGDKPLPVDTDEIEFNPDRNTDRHHANPPRSKGKGKGEKGDIYLGKNYVSEKINQNGLGVVSVSLKTLFTNCRSVSSSLKQPVHSVEEVIIILTLDKPLLSEIQGDYLNPMTLTVGTASQMPANGMNFNDLATRCIPPYIKYRFHDSPIFVSDQKIHAKDLIFNDHNVILLGTMSKELLREFLLGPPLKIEIHDRDPKESLKTQAGIFGSQVDDEEISNVTFTTSQKNGGCDKSFDINFGIAEFDLSELLKGEKILTLVSPIRNFSRPSYDCNNENGSVSKSKGFGIPPGDYLEFGSELKIKIELSRSLIKTALRDSSYPVCNPLENVSVECPYNRMVYIFDYKNKSFLKKIITEINDINATALDILSYPPHVIAAALSTYKLTDQQKEDKTLDVITGCQVIDGIYHMFVLEGISKLGIKRLWDKMEHPQVNEDSFFRVLYNSSMSFSKRIYLSLDVDLTRVCLHQPLSNIVRQPLLYVRDIIPNPCFQAVTKLFQLTECTSLHNAVRNEMFPDAEMIVSLAKEFGIPLTDDDCHDKESVNIEEEDTSEILKINSGLKTDLSQRKVTLRSEPLDMKNEIYEDILEKRKKSAVPKDFVQANIKSLLSLSRSRAQQPTVSCDTIEVAHNYSTQHLNSTEIAKEKLRQILAKDESSRFTYCDRYNSATVVPVSVDKVVKEEEQLSKDTWKTKNGFIFPGFKSSLESNQHPRQIDSARQHELCMPWRENILHRNIVKPCVDRICFRWDDRDLNFDTWKRPPEFFGKPAPVTIHAAGNTLESEKLLAKMRAERKWRDKLVVNDEKFHVHRCLKATELIEKGPNSSNQQDRLQDILKGDPQKLSLRKQGMNLSPIPALSVVSYPQVDTHRRTGQLIDTVEDDNVSIKNVGFHPGEVDGKSWLCDINTIPINDYKHSDFEKTKGHDFRLVHTDREKVLFKIKPMEPSEKDNHLFLVK